MLILSGSNACRRFTDKTRHDRLPEKAILLASNHRGDMRAWICKPAPKVDSAYIVSEQMRNGTHSIPAVRAIRRRETGSCVRDLSHGENVLPDVTDLCRDLDLWLFGLSPILQDFIPTVVSAWSA